MLFYGSVNFHFWLNFSVSTENDISVLGTCQRAPNRIFLSPTIPPNDMVYPKSSTIPNHGHINIYNIYKCFCLTAANMNLLRTSFAGDAYKYTMIFNKYIHVTKEKRIHFISQSHESISKKTNNVHTVSDDMIFRVCVYI